MARVLGIDPGTHIAGYGVLDTKDDGSAHSFVECGVVRLKRDDPLELRLLRLREGLLEIVGRLSPDAIAIESPFVGRNVKAAFSVGEARGVALVIAAENGIPVRQYAPAQVKSTVAGHGRATKQDVDRLLRMQVMMPETKVPADATDALAVAMCDAVQSSSLQTQTANLLR